jgi:tryptophan halogenase
MNLDINKVVIVGGGSAGWMSAATFIRTFPDKEIIVIESPDYPIVGVGESTLGSIKEWTNYIGLDEKDFMPATDAVYKMSIKFTDFYKEDSGSFHYPFGNPFLEGTFNGLNDWYVKKSLYPNLDLADYARTFFPALTLAEQNKLSWNESGKLYNFNFKKDVAYHFDATKFGLWLKNNYCIPRGVKVLPLTVNEVKLNEDGIESLILSNGDSISADLFIDCTGWSSILLGQALNEPFDDYSHQLPNNRAWATRIPYTDIEKEMEPYTNCTAIENGWVWNIPSWQRIGTGYVYSDKYVDSEDALVEFKNYLKSDKMTIHDPNRDVESYEYKDIKFRIGIHNRIWVKNVVAIGLSAGFIEPLESNGLFTVHTFLIKLMKSLNRGTANQWDRDAFNIACKTVYLDFKDFVAMHYALSNRTSTKYWKDISMRSFNLPIKDENYLPPTTFTDLATRKININRYEPNSGMNCIATGMNYFPVDKMTIMGWEHVEGIDYYKTCQLSFENWEKMRKDWQDEADESPTMYQWLKENIHNDKA